MQLSTTDKGIHVEPEVVLSFFYFAALTVHNVTEKKKSGSVISLADPDMEIADCLFFLTVTTSLLS